MKITLSLKTKITIVFAFLFLFLILAILPFHNMQEMKAHEEVVRYYERVMQSIQNKRPAKEELVSYLATLNFKPAFAPQQIIENSMRPIRRDGFELIIAEGNYYLHIVTPHFRILFKDESNKFERSYLDIFVFLFIGSLFSFIYYLILRNINDTQHQLKSRQLFLRTVMHELKTPIAKGRIVTELIEDEKQKSRLITIFEKLNALIDDFAKVEEIVSNNYTLRKQTYTMEFILQRSIELLLLEKRENIVLENISTKKIEVDLELFSLVIKNLIDNALKYSHDTKVIIKEEFDGLLFISSGKALQKPLKEYFKPFHADTQNKNHGMGLGLYIVDAILQLHTMHLEYEYKNEQNIFRIVYSH